MKEAFEVMSTHPLLTVFLGVVLLFSLMIIGSTLTDIFSKND